MVNCPNCDAVIDVDQDELDEGDTLTCDECGADLSVTGLDPWNSKPKKTRTKTRKKKKTSTTTRTEDEDEEEEEAEEEDWH